MRNNKGFTLIELLAVIVILAVLMVIAIPKILNVIESSRNSAASSSIKLLKDSIKTQIASGALTNDNFVADQENCYLFDFDNDENGNVAKLNVKNKEMFSGSTKYCNGVFTDIDLAFNGNNSVVEERTVEVGTKYVFNEAKEYQFTIMQTGKYKFELWGAQGGGNSGGKGAYTSGVISLKKDDIIYVYVGGQGTVNTSSGRSQGGFNGGGQGYTFYNSSVSSYFSGSSGGGSTDVRYNKNLLSSRIMVAAGGGGYSYTSVGNPGGGLSGINYISHSTGGTQTSGGIAEIATNNGTNGGFGYGGDSGLEAVGGGGSGYYGGAGASQSNDNNYGAPSGSSYISGHVGCVAIKSETEIIAKDGCDNSTTNIQCSEHYSHKVFNQTVMKAGNEEMPSHDGSTNIIGNSGNGYAKITLIE